MKNTVIIVFLLCLAIFVGYVIYRGQNITNNILRRDSKKIQITTSIYPLYYLATEIGGDYANVINITPANVEPHDYEPTSINIATIIQSSLFILQGGTIDIWGDKIKNQIQGNSPRIVIARDAVAAQISNTNDPHVWLDPILFKQQAKSISDAIIQIDPTHAEYYKSRTQSLIQSLDQLHTLYSQGLSQCKKNIIVTSHDAFGHLANRYHLVQQSIRGISPESEPSPQKMAELVTLIKSEHISIIFYESMVNPKVSQTIADETGASVRELDPIEGLSDTQLKNGENYLTRMKLNLTNLQEALQCSK